ncbi:outer membrane beta-barrel protein [Catenovulum sp. SM1970]|uniref:OmpW/AlkL family protein n=1 Tax=Marinifaba aquimaris TaxID=2741323 RepID=UPI0015720ACE|nr:OmpW family outer membrane protein [Marinifaba aquimaris]NTS76536.1 outer membrane beta-barrel protein [Marinifaba aquimaris]
MTIISKLAAVCTLALVSQAAFANFSVNIGAITVAPDESSGHLDVIENVAGLPAGSTGVSVDDNTHLGLTIDYAIDDNWTIELVAATPFSQDVQVKGSAINGLNIGEVKHLPPTLFGQHHFGSADDKLRAFVGLGINYTVFFDEEPDAELVSTLQALGVAGANDSVGLELDDSVGLAFQAGANYKIDANWGLHLMVSAIDIDTEANVKVNGNSIQKVDVDIDPFVVMFGARYTF